MTRTFNPDTTDGPAWLPARRSAHEHGATLIGFYNAAIPAGERKHPGWPKRPRRLNDDELFTAGAWGVTGT